MTVTGRDGELLVVMPSEWDVVLSSVCNCHRHHTCTCLAAPADCACLILRAGPAHFKPLLALV